MGSVGIGLAGFVAFIVLVLTVIGNENDAPAQAQPRVTATPTRSVVDLPVMRQSLPSCQTFAGLVEGISGLSRVAQSRVIAERVAFYGITCSVP